MDYVIIGNGESRAPINVDDIKAFKIGCNGIYLHNKVNMLCAMDKFWRDKIEKEADVPLISRKFNNVFQRNLQIHYGGIWQECSCAYRGYVSGTTAMDYICDKAKKGDNIYLLGFDFDYTGETVNHIYKDTQYHPRSNKPAQNENIFLNEAKQIFKRYPRLNFIWVNDNGWELTQTMSIEEFKEKLCSKN